MTRHVSALLCQSHLLEEAPAQPVLEATLSPGAVPRQQTSATEAQAVLHEGHQVTCSKHDVSYLSTAMPEPPP